MALYSQEAIEAPYLEYTINSFYMWNSGQIQVPGTGSSGETAIVRTRKPTAQKVVVWRAIRVNRPPTLPDPEPTDSNLVLHTTQIQPSAPMIAPDGENHIFVVSGVYIYHMKRPQTWKDTLTVPVPPTDNTSRQSVALRPAQFRKGFI